MAGDAWITLFCGRNEDTVAAHRDAGCSSERAFVALLELAVVITTRVDALLVVAFLAYLDDAVAACGLLANARLAWRARASGVHR